MIHHLVRLLRDLDPDVTAAEVADVLWLADHLPSAGRGAPDDRRTAGPGSADPSAPADPPPALDDRVAAAPRQSGGSGFTPPPATAARAAGPDTAELRLPGSVGAEPVPMAALPLRSPAGAALPGPLALARALRPLRQWTPSRTAVLLDEVRTAELSAEARTCIPVSRPASDRWLDAVVVVDESRSSVLWSHTVAELRELLHRLGAFRNVRVWRFDSDAGETPVRLYPESSRAARHPGELRDPAGSRVFVVFSDCLGAGWRSGAVADLLHGWAACAPLVIAQPLPQRLWARSACDAAPARLRSRAPADSNRRLLVSRPGDARPAGAGLPIPVVELSARALGAWAGLVAGQTNGWYVGSVVYTGWLGRAGAAADTRQAAARGAIPGTDDDAGAPRGPGGARGPGGLPGAGQEAEAGADAGAGADGEPAGSAGGPPALAAARRWQAFRATASGDAIELARHLACVPLSLSTMRLVQELLVPESGVPDLAEVFLGGLLRRAAPADGSVPADEVSYEFHPGLRELLLRQLPGISALRVFAEVSDFVAARMGSPQDFLALLAARDLEELASRLSQPFASVALEVLRRVGGRHAEKADEIQRLRGRGVSPGAAGDHNGETPGGPGGRAEGVTAPKSASSAKVGATRQVAGDATRHVAGADVANPSMPALEPAAPQREYPLTGVPGAAARDTGVREIWGGVPARNPAFTGREELLRHLRGSLVGQGTTAVLPQTLHGLGGVGKTQLAVEYAYRFGNEYQLVWWISAEQPAQVRSSLAQLAERLDLPISQDMAQTVRTVLDELANSEFSWLLVYDNADQPKDLHKLVPQARKPRGHVIITSRNHAWHNHLGPAIEVDVFPRAESVELLTRRLPALSAAQADQLADKLGDLPVALEQASTWLGATNMPVEEYLALFDDYAPEFLSEDAPHEYPYPVAKAFGLAFERLRAEAPAASRLFEMFAFLAAEPISTALLKAARAATVTPDLAEILRNPLEQGRAIRQLRRFGLIRIDRQGGLVVHRLVQVILRAILTPERRAETRENVHGFLAEANPSYPDNPDNPDDWPLHAEIGLHVAPSGVIHSPDREVLGVPLDQIRYLYAIGDFDGSLAMARACLEVWRDGLGPDHEVTLIATRHLANTLRAIGATEEARALNEETLSRLRGSPEFGELHEHTLATANSYGADLRIRGLFTEARDLDEENRTKHLQVFDADDGATLRSMNNLAVDLRLLGDFRGALAIDQEIIQRRQATTREMLPESLFSISNLVRDLYGLGEYREALETQQQWLPAHRALLGAQHTAILLANRSLAICLRKLGRFDDALTLAGENYRIYLDRFGPAHEHTLAARMTYANSLRAAERFEEARRTSQDGLQRYQDALGADHPFSLAARVNHAIILRAAATASGVAADQAAARELDERTLTALGEQLGEGHPYTLCCANNLSNDLSLAGEHAAAYELSDRTWHRSVELRGPEHPYTLACAVNRALDAERAVDAATGQRELEQAVAALAARLGADHPETRSARLGHRAECDIEPPPT